ncbi:hypothetical protein PoB_002113800 [Plakobranchus ocellatus]|uniref:Uncharacterized protein n=1 Tax=Plakobranchus ocellatus TaxID=259542 RepID=A0AAV3ZJF4_9GAST|nr:hypothetical protein PoB_002113800 [Plakobranchus ocellatus]
MPGWHMPADAGRHWHTLADVVTLMVLVIHSHFVDSDTSTEFDGLWSTESIQTLTDESDNPKTPEATEDETCYIISRYDLIKLSPLSPSNALQ